MRLLVLALAATLPAGSAAALADAPEPNGPAERPKIVLPDEPLHIPATKDGCRKLEMREADRRGPAQFKRLDELPDAKGYMAVYRTVDGCEVPLTVVEYRQRLGR